MTDENTAPIWGGDWAGRRVKVHVNWIDFNYSAEEDGVDGVNADSLLDGKMVLSITIDGQTYHGALERRHWQQED